MATNIIVTDGELGRLARKQNELFMRVKKGTLSVDLVLHALQRIIEGQEWNVQTSNSKKSYPVWKKIKIGGVRRRDLRVRMVQKRQLNNWAYEMMQQKKFTTLPKEEDVDLIILTPSDFGFKAPPETDVYLSEENLTNWSNANLVGYKLEVCPAEVGPRLREQYIDQDEGEVICIAMERIICIDTPGIPPVPLVFQLISGRSFLPRLHASEEPGEFWPLYQRTAFRLRKVTVS